METKKINLPEKEVRCVVSELRVEARSESETGRTISGYAAVFEEWSEPICWFKEKVARSAFDGADFDSCIMCFNHDTNSIMARVSSGTLTHEIDERGLKFSFDAPNTTLGNDMVELVARGDVSQCSFKFRVEEDNWTYADKDNGLELDERTITKFSKIYDMSLVVHPAYSNTEASVRQLEERKAQALKSTDNSNPNDMALHRAKLMIM